jgi:tRNA-splicing ligase RtcB (3'-phosphate/5'-hydroxy nucleic acid ligase)
MAKIQIRGKDLMKMGYPEGPVIGLCINLIPKHYKRHTQEQVDELLQSILANPSDYAEDAVLGRIVEALVQPEKQGPVLIDLLPKAKTYPVFGAEKIEAGAIEQMETAMRLPVTHAGALMPDAHQGYGLPIGGVLATENAVIPYGVGMDIGCRMCMTIYPVEPQALEAKRSMFKKLLLENTRFGFSTFEKPMDDAIFERREFREVPKLRSLKGKAWEQIGSSGSGNHFVEFGIVEIMDEHNEFNLPLGKYLGLMSHSGSRGLGATLAQYYTKLAMETCNLPKQAQHLAWLDLDTEAGQEYWIAMNLAGDYASACHHQIHHRMAKSLGEKSLAIVENHHNFAWKEILADGKEYIVHRKGATPAGKGVLGVIPGSMTAPAFIVRGKGFEDSLNSASHGAGRQMSRRQALSAVTKSDLDKHLRTHGVELLGGGLDEAPFAYKNIHQVMAAQESLVETIGTFHPKVVRMEGDS